MEMVFVHQDLSVTLREIRNRFFKLGERSESQGVLGEFDSLLIRDLRMIEARKKYPNNNAETSSRSPIIMVVDDEEGVRDVLSRYVSRAGYQYITASDGIEALVLFKDEDIALVLSDITMPGMNGLQLLDQIKLLDPDMPVIMITALRDIDMAIQAMKRGAQDYIPKPFNFDAVSISIARALEKRRLILENRDYQRNLEEKVRERTREIEELFLNTVTSLAHSLEARDKYTSGHSERVADYSALIARNLDFSRREEKDVHLAGLLHDIGKIGIREAILNKKAKLNDQEYDHIKSHPVVAVRILEPITQLRRVLPAIKFHHERFDGKGYPDGLKGKEIPLGARILAVSDTFDAMTSERPYRSPYSLKETLQKMKQQSGHQFDPEILEIFLKSVDLIKEIAKK